MQPTHSIRVEHISRNKAMKITKNRLKQLIKEELENFNEGEFDGLPVHGGCDSVTQLFNGSPPRCTTAAVGHKDNHRFLCSHSIYSGQCWAPSGVLSGALKRGRIISI